jgi:cytochrome c oxidase subunit 2
MHAATRIAVEQSWLHWFMLITCTVIFLAGVLRDVLFHLEAPQVEVGHKPANFHESVTVEVIWTAIPFIIVILMALPATKVLVASKDTSNADVTIKATGYQWKWGYDYLARAKPQGVSFLSTLDSTHREMSNDGAKAADIPNNYLLKVDNPLVVPVNKKVRIITTANDVIHAWGVPAFGVKQDAIPGFVRDTWFRSREDRRLLRPVLRAVRQGARLHADPREGGVGQPNTAPGWAGEQKKVMAAKADDPNKVWKLDRHRRPRREGLCGQLRRLPPARTARAPVRSSRWTARGSCSMRTSPSRSTWCCMAVPTAMPSWKQLSDTDIAAVISYTKNSWSNKTGQVVQPAEVLAAARQVRSRTSKQNQP